MEREARPGSMRILLLTHNRAGLGGSFLRGFSIGRALSALGHEVTLVASRGERGFRTLREYASGLEIVQMPDALPARIRHGGLSPMDLLGRLMLSNSCDLVHGFDHRPAVSIPALWMRWSRRVPYVADWADLWGRGGIADHRPTSLGRALGGLDGYGEREVHRRADAVTVVTEELGIRARELGVPGDRVRRIGIGASSDVIRPLPRAAARAAHGIPEGASVVVHSGFAPYDGRLLAESFVALSRLNPSVVLLLTGATAPEVMKTFEAFGVAGRVRSFGIVPYECLGEILACGDVMLLPFTRRSLNTARFPNRAGDYLAAGRPVVTNPTGELGRLVEREGVGVLASEDAESFAKAIDDLLRDEPRRREMGERARRLAETRMSWGAVASELDRFYRALLEDWGTSSIRSSSRSSRRAMRRGSAPP
jgi:glycosyltransferase involved in cell wall biosynthesis